MRREDESELSRALLGDAEAQQALARRKAESPELAAELEPMERVWQELELPAPAPAPAGFAARTAAVAASERILLPGFMLSPAWSAVAAALLLAIGVVGGAGLELYALTNEGSDEVAEASEFWSDDGLLDEQLFEADGAAGDTASESGTPDEVAP